jgi:UDP-N-acetylmuramyl pentapeptide synthase
MAARTRARVLTYGLVSPGADVRGEDVSASWPDRLSMTVVSGSERVHVQTRLVGEHVASHVLAALATAMAAGVPLDDAVRSVALVDPIDGRCSVHEAGGVTFIRDDWKAPLWSIPASIRALATARASRRILVLGTISDYPGATSPKYRAVAREAAATVDHVFFVGPMGARTTIDAPPGRVTAFETLAALNAHLDGYLQPGDLVLLKGSATVDHLQRLVLARDGGVSCWRPACGRTMFWASCDLRHRAG